VRRAAKSLHFLNPVPLQEIYERWIAKFGKTAPQGALGFKTTTGENQWLDRPLSMYLHPHHAGEAVVSTDRRGVHEASYWFGMHCESQWTAGSSWKMYPADGQITDAGEIIEAEPPRRLVIAGRHQNKPRAQGRGRLAMARWNWNPAEPRSGSPSPTPSSATLRNSSRQCPAAGQDHLQPEVPYWRPAPLLCMTRTRVQSR